MPWVAHDVRHAAAVMLLVLRQMAPSLSGDLVATLQEKLQHAAAQLDTLQQEVQQLSVARVRTDLPEAESPLRDVQHPSIRNGVQHYR